MDIVELSRATLHNTVYKLKTTIQRLAPGAARIDILQNRRSPYTHG